MRVVKIDKETTKDILSDLLKRSPNQYDSYADSVQEILDAVKEKGDEALFGYTEKFDGCKLTPKTVQVTEEEIAAAYEKVGQDLVEVIRKAMEHYAECFLGGPKAKEELKKSPAWSGGEEEPM